MVADFAPELILAVFQFLPLKSLFAARAVNRPWHTLVAMTDMTPERRSLYDFYFTVIASPAFLASRNLVLASLVSFDRAEYIARLEQPTGTILPCEFRCWVLEWPEKAVFGWSWPGLDSYFDCAPYPWKPYGANCIGSPLSAALQPLAFYYPAGANPHPPETDEIKAKYCDDDVFAFYEDSKGANDELVMSRGLQIWDYGCTCYTWMVVDNHKPLLHGTMHYCDKYRSHREAQLVAVGWVTWLGAGLGESDGKYFRSLD